jgi:hypothetical protein
MPVKKIEHCLISANRIFRLPETMRLVVKEQILDSTTITFYRCNDVV